MSVNKVHNDIPHVFVDMNSDESNKQEIYCAIDTATDSVIGARVRTVGHQLGHPAQALKRSSSQAIKDSVVHRSHLRVKQPQYFGESSEHHDLAQTCVQLFISDPRTLPAEFQCLRSSTDSSYFSTSYPLMITLPPEIIGKIAQELRALPYAEKSEPVRRHEDAALASLCLVSRMFREEAVRPLWEDICIRVTVPDVRVAAVSLQISNLKEKYFQRVLSLHIIADSTSLHALNTFNMNNLLFQTRFTLRRLSALKNLALNISATVCAPMLEELYSLTFPSLSSLRLHVSQSSEEIEGICMFLLRHPSLEYLDLHIRTMLAPWVPEVTSLPWGNFRVRPHGQIPFPRLRELTGSADTLALFARETPLESCTLINVPEESSLFILKTAPLDGPFLHLTSLKITEQEPVLDREFLEVLTELTPNIRKLKGFRINEEFLRLFQSEDPRKAICLGKLERLVISEHAYKYAPLDKRGVQRAILELPSIFPSLATVIYTHANMHWKGTLRFHFNHKGYRMFERGFPPSYY
ncbi:hypothetical protein SISNIDRAFT_547359 [Sistotremastrum niveocremeum HHB9708]|uniref:Uncharacterized protein n=1 Tax=Sistotremastrum niveocremeum HHB9708 TaxID=1314777 RepID=A0A164YZU9_9AGAM|nr:hypothetical protein SISNIDRAFT_547359 [Sistotremastrum niveocremeum HHB9708]